MLLCASTILVAVLDDGQAAGISGWLGKPALSLLGAVYCVLLAAVLRPGFTALAATHRARYLGMAMAASLALDFDNLASLNLFALPFAIPAGRRRPWIWAQAGILLIHFQAWLKLYDPAQRAKLASIWPAQKGELMAAIGAGLLQLAAWALFAYFVGSLLVQLETDRRLLRRSNAELRATRTMLAEATRTEERLRISRELHDSVGHYLTSLSLQLEIAENIGTGPVAGPIGRAKLLVRLLLAEVRDAAAQWRVEQPAALAAAIRELCGEIPGLRVELDLAADLPPASPGTTNALFRIVQEALTNTLRHSGARSFSVKLQKKDNQFELDIRDDGRGAACYRSGTGLTGMKERVRDLGGELEIDSSPSFHIRALIPAAKGPEA